MSYQPNEAPVKEDMKSVEDAYFKRVFEVFKEFGQEERHFNTLEQQYRLLASTWMMATFAAMGYILKEYAVINAVNDNGKWFFVSAIAFVGCTGIGLLGYLDQRAYHKLLHAVFITGVELEAKYDFLPKMRTNMLAAQDNKDITKRVAFFYILPVVIFFAISAFSCTYGLYKAGLSGVWLVFIPVAGLMLLMVLLRKFYLTLF